MNRFKYLSCSFNLWWRYYYSFNHHHQCCCSNTSSIHRRALTTTTTTTILSNERYKQQKYYYTLLSDRAVISITGPECYEFIQGLITNDVRHLQENSNTSVALSCIYAFMLNTSGRIVVDMFLYRWPNQNNQLLLEVDAKMKFHIVALLKRYKIRRKVTVEPIPTGQIAVIYPQLAPLLNRTNQQFQKATQHQLIVRDPRNYNFGYRILTLNNSEISQSNEFHPEQLTKELDITDFTIEQSNIAAYRTFRYKLGVGEGIIDYPPETILPFEANIELLNGISFQKGCYIGQELTARAYHTGVIRKRLLPIELIGTTEENEILDKTNHSLPVQTVISDKNNKPMGRFQVNLHRNGLAILKFAELLQKDDNDTSLAPIRLSQSDYRLHSWKPFWWPNSI